jgi:hypothetical protein
VQRLKEQVEIVKCRESELRESQKIQLQTEHDELLEKAVQEYKALATDVIVSNAANNRLK